MMIASPVASSPPNDVDATNSRGEYSALKCTGQTRSRVHCGTIENARFAARGIEMKVFDDAVRDILHVAVQEKQQP